MTRVSHRAGLAATLVVALASMPGCMTYSAFEHLRKPKKVTDMAPVFVIGNLVGGAIAGTVAADMAMPGDGAETFGRTLLIWNFADFLISCPLMALGLVRDGLDGV